jgi:hypothetical protein
LTARSRRTSSSHAPLSAERRRRLIQRGIPLIVAVAIAALGVGMLLGGIGESDSQRTAKRFARAWEKRDFRTMHELVDPPTQDRASLEAFRAAYDRAAATATATSFDLGTPKEDGDKVVFPVTVKTRIFGTVRQPLTLEIRDERVVWDRSLTFPGLRKNQSLNRSTKAPARAPIAARDGKVIVTGPANARTFPLGDGATSLAGTVGPPETDAEREELRERGFPEDTPIGRSGLERATERYVAGTPGGRLSAGSRTLAATEPRQAEPVKTTIDLDIQQAAVDALAGRFGGIAALDAQTGEVRALAGIAFSAPQPPGSTFKIITTVAALEERKVKQSDKFPVETKAVIDGVDLENANGESCGGTFIETFAHSCNSVFAPLGVEVGADKLVEVAERFGFNGSPTLPGEIASTLPAADEIGGPLAVGSTAIGQGKVLATPLEMASVAQTIAADGVRYPPTLVAGDEGAQPVRVTTARVARVIEKAMVAVTTYGTGTLAKLDGAKVAGKTGTAELEDTTDEERPSEENTTPGSDTDAWFTAYTPIKKPKIAVGVLFVRLGAGGDTAAPAARQVLAAGLKAK